MSIITLYHGQKDSFANEIKKFNFNPYLYMTNNYKYALLYANGNEDMVYKCEVNDEKFFDVSELGGKMIPFTIIQNFMKKAGFSTPIDFKMMFFEDYVAFWQLLKIKSIFKEYMDQIIKKGFDGIKMFEERGGKIYQSYVLFNSKPIISFTKMKLKESLINKIFKESNDRKLGNSLTTNLGKTSFVVMYRACAMSSTKFLDKDYVTLNKKFAIEHAENNHVYYEEPYHVIQAVISTDKLFDAYNPGEYFYSGEPKKGKEIYVSKGPDEYEGLIESVLQEFPTIKKVGKKVMADDKPLKTLTVEDVVGNIVFIREPNGNFMVAKGRTWGYFMDSPQAAEDLKHQKIDMLMFPIVPRFNFNVAPITDIWKKKYAKGKGVEHILAVFDGYTDEDEIFIDKISVRPQYQRNHIGKLMLDNLRKEFPNAKVTITGVTDAGREFVSKYTNTDKSKLSKDGEVEKRDGKEYYINNNFDKDLNFISGTKKQNNLTEKILLEFWGKKAAGILPICSSTGRTLLCLRSPEINEGNTWGIWGGVAENEKDNNMLSVAKREFNEETKFTGSIKIIPAYVFKTIGFEYHNFIGIVETEFKPEINWESSDYKWVNFNELYNMNSLHWGLVELLKNSGDIIHKYMNIKSELVEKILKEYKSIFSSIIEQFIKDWTLGRNSAVRMLSNKEIVNELQEKTLTEQSYKLYRGIKCHDESELFEAFKIKDFSQVGSSINYNISTPTSWTKNINVAEKFSNPYFRSSDGSMAKFKEIINMGYEKDEVVSYSFILEYTFKPEQLVADLDNVNEKNISIPGEHEVIVLPGNYNVKIISKRIWRPKDLNESIKKRLLKEKKLNNTKVVDKSGNLLIVYHGTNHNFEDFQKYAINSNTNTNGSFGPGFYFTEIPSDAEYYGKKIFKVYLNLENPLIVNSTKEYREIVKKEIEKRSINRFESDKLLSKSSTDILKDAGYDGVIFKFNGKMKEIVAFEPNQIFKIN